MEENIKTNWSLENCFKELRFSQNHLGLGDIRLTLDQQEEIVKLVSSELSSLKNQLSLEITARDKLATLVGDLEKENEDLKKKIEEIIEALKESKFTMEWMWKNMAVVDQNLQSDAFNIPANAITQADQVLDKYIK